ncbi:MAG TPA: hypothetical protein VIF85_03880, partial [Gaiellaceae bacterium]
MLNILDTHICRSWHRFTKDHRVLRRKTRQLVEDFATRKRRGVANELLIGGIHRSVCNQRAALGEDGPRQFSRTLRSRQDSQAELPALLGQSLKGCAGPRIGGGRNVTVCLLQRKDLHRPARTDS